MLPDSPDSHAVPPFNAGHIPPTAPRASTSTPSPPRRRPEVIILSPSPATTAMSDSPPSPFTPATILTASPAPSRLPSPPRARPYSPPPHLPPTPPVVTSPSRRSTRPSHRGAQRAGTHGTEDEEDEDEEAGSLFLTSLRNGLRSRQRRRGPIDSPVLHDESEQASMDEDAIAPAVPALSPLFSRLASTPLPTSVSAADPLSALDPVDRAAANAADAPDIDLITVEPEDELRWRQRSTAPAPPQLPPHFGQTTSDLRLRVIARHMSRSLNTVPATATTPTESAPTSSTVSMEAIQPFVVDSTPSRPSSDGLRAPVAGFRAPAAMLTVYCGSATPRLDQLPKGFKYTDTSQAPVTPSNGGCGTLISIRGYKHTDEFGCPSSRRRAPTMISTDAPPLAGSLGPAPHIHPEDTGDDLWVKCSCIKELVGCLHCGLLVGFRLNSDGCLVCKSRLIPTHRLYFSKVRVTCRPRIMGVFPPCSTSIIQPRVSPPEDVPVAMTWPSAPSLEADLALGVMDDYNYWFMSNSLLSPRGQGRRTSGVRYRRGVGSLRTAVGDSRRLRRSTLLSQSLFATQNSDLPPAPQPHGNNDEAGGGEDSSSRLRSSSGATGLTRRSSIRVRRLSAAGALDDQLPESTASTLRLSSQFPTSHTRGMTSNILRNGIPLESLSPIALEPSPSPLIRSAFDRVGAQSGESFSLTPRSQAHFEPRMALTEPNSPSLSLSNALGRQGGPFGYGSLYDYVMDSYRSTEPASATGVENETSPPSDPTGAQLLQAFRTGSVDRFHAEMERQLRGGRGVTPTVSGNNVQTWSDEEEEFDDGCNEVEDEDDIWKECWPRQRRRLGLDSMTLTGSSHHSESRQPSRMRFGGAGGSGSRIHNGSVLRSGGNRSGIEVSWDGLNENRRFNWTGEVCAR